MNVFNRKVYVGYNVRYCLIRVLRHILLIKGSYVRLAFEEIAIRLIKGGCDRKVVTDQEDSGSIRYSQVLRLMGRRIFLKYICVVFKVKITHFGIYQDMLWYFKAVA